MKYGSIFQTPSTSRTAQEAWLTPTNLYFKHYFHYLTPLKANETTKEDSNAHICQEVYANLSTCCTRKIIHEMWEYIPDL